MAWGGVDTYITGQLVTAANLNKISDDLAYLHGDAGAINYANNAGLNVNGDAGGAADLYLINSGNAYARVTLRNSARGWNLWNDVGGILYVRRESDGATPLAFDGSVTPVAVKANGMRVHRHPYGNDRHIESGSPSLPGGGLGVGSAYTASVTYTDAFVSAPIPSVSFYDTSGVDNGGLSVQPFARSAGTTGFTIKALNMGGSTSFGGTTAYGALPWIVEGQD